MSASATPVPKQDLPKELWRVATTLSDEAQKAAIHKCRELGFDPNKGRIPLEETLVNVSQSRDVLLDAVERDKFVQIPLSIQNLLLRQTQKVSESLTALMNGTDAILNLSDAAENLTASVWQYNLYNLSDKVLGFHQKMNQLKTQEVLIKQAHREAEDFAKSRQQASDLLGDIAASAKACAEQLATAQALTETISNIHSKVVEHEQTVAGLNIQIQQHDATATQHSANAKTAAADVEAVSTKTKALQTEIDETRSGMAELRSNLQELLSDGEQKIEEAINTLQQEHELRKTESAAEAASLRESLEGQATGLRADLQMRAENAIAALEEHGAQLEEQVSNLVSGTKDLINQTQSDHESALKGQINDFVTKSEALRSALQAQIDQQVSQYGSEYQKLVSELDTLEGRIRKSIERATGYTLFHSFQTLQLDLAKSKNFWAWALAATVGISLLASGYLIYSLSATQQYNAAFYLKLAISVPLIYAIAFCSVQYSRERRLEEEYAFKSSISISLDPYQKLVAQLVDKDKPEELAKYTAFIIESVNRVFTSPTASIFDEHPKDKTSAEKVIKAFGEAIGPLVKAIKK